MSELQRKMKKIVFLAQSRLNRNAAPKHVPSDHPMLLDTSLYSDNAGDEIIMHFAERQITRIWSDNRFDRLPTHGIACSATMNDVDRLKLFCGTNALSTRTNEFALAFAQRAEIYRDLVALLGVGLKGLQYSSEITPAMASLLKYLLSNDYVHSVRDSHTERALRNIGIDNVINTSCVTMWNLTSQFCSTIPTGMHKDVLTTITDYDQDSVADEGMLQTLKRHYRHVYVWLQGVGDERYISSLNVQGLDFVRGGFAGLQAFVDAHEDFDYFGTRLHCGIYCLNHGIRSMIVIIDNRARDIYYDTNIPAVERDELQNSMDELIEADRPTDIHVPLRSIEKWKSQFMPTGSAD